MNREGVLELQMSKLYSFMTEKEAPFDLFLRFLSNEPKGNRTQITTELTTDRRSLRKRKWSSGQIERSSNKYPATGKHRSKRPEASASSGPG